MRQPLQEKGRKGKAKSAAASWVRTGARRRAQAGRSLMESLTVLAIVGILAGISAPYFVNQLSSFRRSATMREMEMIKNALVGDAALAEGGVRKSFGYLGDVGELPETILDLVAKPSQLPSFRFDDSLNLGAGWAGPYLSKEFQELQGAVPVDKFGQPYVYTTRTTPSGVRMASTIQSLGADRAPGGTDANEDLILRVEASETHAHLFGKVVDENEAPLGDTPITVHFPRRGVPTRATTRTNSAGTYEFRHIPLGVRTLSVEPRPMYVAGSALTLENSVEFKITNPSPRAVTISSLQVEHDLVPTAFFERIRLADTVVAQAPPNRLFGSTDSVLCNFTLPPAEAAQGFFKTVTVDHAEVQVAPLVVKPQVQKTLTVRLENFRRSLSVSPAPPRARGINYLVIRYLCPGNMATTRVMADPPGSALITSIVGNDVTLQPGPGREVLGRQIRLVVSGGTGVSSVLLDTSGNVSFRDFEPGITLGQRCFQIVQVTGNFADAGAQQARWSGGSHINLAGTSFKVTLNDGSVFRFTAQTVNR